MPLPNEIDVVELTAAEDLVWPFHGGNTLTPAPYFRVGGSYEYVDPFPAYAHDRTRVVAQLRDVARIWPPGGELLVAVTDRETTSRTNAVASKGYGDQPNVICLSGKRIPPHPAMTRYLCAHEYGHNVQYWLENARGEDAPDLLEEYRELRRLEPRAYGGGQWHHSIGEVFACDFRMVICGVETEFWPHHGVLPPSHLPAIGEWWSDAQRFWRDHLAERAREDARPEAA